MIGVTVGAGRRGRSTRRRFEPLHRRRTTGPIPRPASATRCRCRSRKQRMNSRRGGAKHSRSRQGAGPARCCCGSVADGDRGHGARASTTATTCSACSRSAPTSSGEDLGRVARPRSIEAVADAGDAAGEGVNVAVRGQIAPMQQMFAGLQPGLGIAVARDLPAAGGELPVVPAGAGGRAHDAGGARRRGGAAAAGSRGRR